MRSTACAALIALTPFAALATAGDPPPPSAELQAALQGRRAGPPQDCIGLREAGSSRIVDGAIIYQQGRSRWSVNRPDRGACDVLKRDRAIITVTPATRLCRGDIIRIIDPFSRIEYGSCALDSFTPSTLDR